jgi:hypothetical protein
VFRDVGSRVTPVNRAIGRWSIRPEQGGGSRKSTVVAAKALHTSIHVPGALTLLVGPTQRQSAELALKVAAFKQKIEPAVPVEEQSKFTIELANGSRIVSLPGDNPKLIRGYSAPALVIEDEAAYCSDALYNALVPMLAASPAEVLIMPYRNPIATAKSLATIDRMSGGRLIAGVGVGWNESEFDALGMPFHERGPRTNEYLRLWQACWAPGKVSFAGRYFSFSNMHVSPKPVQQPLPPIWIGGASDAALRRAARFAAVGSLHRCRWRSSSPRAILDQAPRARARRLTSPSRALRGEITCPPSR